MKRVQNNENGLNITDSALFQLQSGFGLLVQWKSHTGWYET
jgi:hypothetical protein